MATLQETINEGVNYNVELTIDEDTSQSSLEVILFDKFDNGSEEVVATTTGSVADDPIDITLDFSTVNKGYYLLEIWADRSDTENRRLIYPNEDDEFTLEIKDRKGI